MAIFKCHNLIPEGFLALKIFGQIRSLSGSPPAGQRSRLLYTLEMYRARATHRDRCGALEIEASSSITCTISPTRALYYNASTPLQYWRGTRGGNFQRILFKRPLSFRNQHILRKDKGHKDPQEDFKCSCFTSEGQIADPINYLQNSSLVCSL